MKCVTRLPRSRSRFVANQRGKWLTAPRAEEIDIESCEIALNLQRSPQNRIRIIRSRGSTHGQSAPASPIDPIGHPTIGAPRGQPLISSRQGIQDRIGAGSFRPSAP